MLLSISEASWLRILELLLPRVDVLLDVIVLWVALRLRSTYEAEQQTLSSLVTRLQRSSELPAVSGSPRRARDRRKSSTKGTTST